MSYATVTTQSGGIFTMTDAFMIGTDTIVGEVGGSSYTLELNEGDSAHFYPGSAPTTERNA